MTTAPTPTRPAPISCARSSPRTTRNGKYGGRVVTRFPPEPNGYLHYGHAKSIVLNFGLAAENGGTCHLRFDDTNPLKEDVEYEDSIAASVRWLGYDWGTHRYHASDYYDVLYEFAEWFVDAGARVRRQPVGRRDARDARHADASPGIAGPVSRPQRRREPRPAATHARGRIPRRRARAAPARSTWRAPTSTCATR